MQIALSAVRRLKAEDGQDLLEYGMLAALIALFAMGAITAVGNTITGVFWSAIAASSI